MHQFTGSVCFNKSKENPIYRRQAKPICHWSQEMIDLGMRSSWNRTRLRTRWIVHDKLRLRPFYCIIYALSLFKGLDQPNLCVMPYLIGSIALVIALTAIFLVFYDMYKAFRRDFADFNPCDNWDVTLTELDHTHTDTSHSVRAIQIISISRTTKSQNSHKYPRPSTTRRLSVPHWLHLNRTYKTIKNGQKDNSQ